MTEHTGFRVYPPGERPDVGGAHRRRLVAGGDPHLVAEHVRLEGELLMAPNHP
jgi:hypothetical protein